VVVGNVVGANGVGANGVGMSILSLAESSTHRGRRCEGEAADF